MALYKKLLKQTFIYGLATVLPRILSVILVPLYVKVLLPEEYGVYASLMAFLILGNVLLSYGMETAFFRFVTKKSSDTQKVQSTTLTSLTVSSLIFLGVTLLFKDSLASFSDFKPEYVTYVLWILTLDALVVLPFVWFRANENHQRVHQPWIKFIFLFGASKLGRGQRVLGTALEPRKQGCLCLYLESHRKWFDLVNVAPPLCEDRVRIR